MDFPLASTRYVYRPLKRGQEGWDVFGLQTALATEGATLIADGTFGPQTGALVREFQKERNLVEDGIAGIATQSKLCSVIARRESEKRKFPAGIPYGHLEKESGCLFGNHTAPYVTGDAAGSRDLGVTQRNDRFAKRQAAFDAHDSINTLCDRVAAKFAEYRKDGAVERRAWELACGSWNAPAWTDALAEGDPLSDWQREWIEGYIDRVTAYVSWS